MSSAKAGKFLPFQPLAKANGNLKNNSCASRGPFYFLPALPEKFNGVSGIPRLTFACLGYAFYHARDTERATDGGGLYIGYGDESEMPDRHVQIGREIVEALRAEGFSPLWNETAAQRMFVPIEWRKRRAAA